MIQLFQSVETRQQSFDVPLELATRLFEQMNSAAMRYCHWKSNEALSAALAGTGDLDLLVDPADVPQFERILAELGFELFHQPAWQSQPAVLHYYGHDEPTGKLLHLHVYYALVTGGHILKNYRLPLESMLLTNSHLELGVRVVDRAAELAVFVLRKMLESGGWIELALQRRDQAHVDREWFWLLPEDPDRRNARLREAYRLLSDCLPQLDAHTFARCVEALSDHQGLFGRYLLGRAMRRLLSGYTLRGRATSACASAGRVVRLAVGRVLRCGSRKRPSRGGRVVALIGPEASGKSTYCECLSRWLGGVMESRAVHMGKPSSSFAGRVVNFARRARKWLRRRQTASEAHGFADRETLPDSFHRPTWYYALASVLLARDRYRLALHAHREAARGKIVICDRYPSRSPGAVDGPRLNADPRHPLPRWLGWAARCEQSYYHRIPPADQLLELSVPVGVAQDRNRHRVKADKEDDLYLAQRYVQFHAGRAEQCDALVVTTDAPMAEVLRKLRTLVWNRLPQCGTEHRAVKSVARHFLP